MQNFEGEALKVVNLVVRFASMIIEAFRNEIDDACLDEHLIHVSLHPDGIVHVVKYDY